MSLSRWALSFVVSVVIALVYLPSAVPAATLEWDRNAESDMQDYQVWACFTPSCVVIKSPANLQPGTVVQPVAGVTPSYVIDLTGREGSIAISARDRSLNESGLSAPVPFDQRPPTVPVNPRFR